MTYDTIEFGSADGIARIVLNRPDSLNSFNAQMHADLRDAFTRIEADASVRCLLLTGNGRGFCAGQDLNERGGPNADAGADLGETLETLYNPLLRTIKALRYPVVCAVNGVAAGAGANLALVCDIVIAGRSARFIQAFCKIGLVPDSGGTWILPRLVGHARAMGLALTGASVSAEQAADWGMIWECVDDEHLPERAEALCATFAVAPTYGLSLIKQALNASTSNSFDAQLDLERDLQRLAGQSADFREGVAAFLEKRAARFQGR
jgi:2-(1,2-epoxy-1,2-dihydrophenyl)acetyl-CoA isomerase